jgi:signal peptidase II
MNTPISFARRLVWIAVTALACVGLDQFTKAIAKSQLTLGDLHSFWGDTVRFQLAHNTGAFLSLGASLPDSVRQLVLSVGVGLLLSGLLVYAFISKVLDRTAITALALIFAGGVSNLGDRIVYGGYVVDFVQLGIGPVRTGIFNVADMAIMAGTFMLLIDAFRKDKRV